MNSCQVKEGDTQILGDLNVTNYIFRLFFNSAKEGIPGWHSSLAPAFGPGRDPGDPGSNPTLGSHCMEPASPSAYVSASVSLCVCVTVVNKKKKRKKKKNSAKEIKMRSFF